MAPYFFRAGKEYMGIDAGFGSSNFGIVVSQLTYGKAEVVVFTEKYERPNFGDMIRKIIDIRQNYGVDKLFVDAANPRLSDHSSVHLMNLRIMNIN